MRATSSNFLVSSRAITSSRCGAETLGAASASVAGDAVRRFVEDHRPGQRRAPRAPCAAPAFAGRKPANRKPSAAKPASRERRRRGARPGQRAHADALAVRRRHQQRAGIRHRRRAGVAHQRDVLPSRSARDQLLGRRALVVRVQRHGARGDAVVREQGARGARVLAGDDVGAAQRLDGARARVGEVADRRGDDVKRSGLMGQPARRGVPLRLP